MAGGGLRGRVPIACAALALLLASGPAPGQSRANVEERLQRLERQLESNVLLDLLDRLDRLQAEVRELRGELEAQSDGVAEMGRRQRELFLDLDRRLKRLEPAGGAGGAATVEPAAPGQPPPSSAAARPPGAAVPPAPAPPPAAASPTAGRPAAPVPPAAEGGDPLKEQAAYQQAFNLLKEGRYDQAAKSFTAFLKTYPSGQHADSAQYWLGESYYVNRQFQPALTEFGKLLQAYPSSAKVSHAKLKIGLIYSETGNPEEAKKVLTEVATKYPNTPQARLAQERLQQMKGQ